jgi:hypothetical protein
MIVCDPLPRYELEPEPPQFDAVRKLALLDFGKPVCDCDPAVYEYPLVLAPPFSFDAVASLLLLLSLTAFVYRNEDAYRLHSMCFPSFTYFN